MKQETIYDSINDGDVTGLPGLIQSDDKTIQEIVEICEFCSHEEITEINDAKRVAREKSVACLFKEIRGIDSTIPI